MGTSLSSIPYRTWYTDQGTQDAIARLNYNIHQDWVETPVKSLFTVNLTRGDIETVKLIYQSVVANQGPKMNISFYCEEDHIVWDSSIVSWVDLDYTYEENGQERAVEYKTNASQPTEKPGSQGRSNAYTTLGIVLFTVSLMGDHLTIGDPRIQSAALQQPNRRLQQPGPHLH